MERAGVEIVQYALDGRIQYSAGWLEWVYKQKAKENPDTEKPTQGDYLYLAGIGALERALRHQVDWVFLISGAYIHPDVLVIMRRAGLKVAVLLTESPYYDQQEILISKVADVVWTNERISVETFRPYCPHVYYYQHAYDPEAHNEERAEVDGAKNHDAVFVGTGFIERCEILSGVNWDGIDFGLYGSWSLLGSRSKLRQHIAGDIVANELTAELYHRAKIGLNIHRTSIGFGRHAPHVPAAESMNPRCYELAATGTFFISDYRAELEEVFGDAVPTFTDSASLEEQVRYWLDHEKERRRIEEALPELIKPHTFDNRVDDILRVLTRYRR